MRKQGKNNVKIARKNARGPMKAMVSPSIRESQPNPTLLTLIPDATALWWKLPPCYSNSSFRLRIGNASVCHAAANPQCLDLSDRLVVANMLIREEPDEEEDEDGKEDDGHREGYSE